MDPASEVSERSAPMGEHRPVMVSGRVKWERSSGARPAWGWALWALMACGALGLALAEQASGQWVASGPAENTFGQTEGDPGGLMSSQQFPTSGSVGVVLPSRISADTLFIGTVNGGVWRTRNATSLSPTWVPLTDGQSSLSMAALVFDLADPTENTLWAGNGRYSSFGFGGSYAGLLKSTDGGDNWTRVDGNGGIVGQSVRGLGVKGGVIVIATDFSELNTLGTTGVFRSTDGGASFSHISGGGTGLPGGRAWDLAVDPTNTNILYTAVTFAERAGGINGLYRSTDFGASWSRVSAGSVLETDMSDSSVTTRVRVVVGNAGQVYAGVVHLGSFHSLHRSATGAGAWVQLDSPQTNEGSGLQGLNPEADEEPRLVSPPDGTPFEAGGQGSIHFSIGADPLNANVVYVGGDRQPSFNESSGNGSFPNSLGANNYSGRLFRVDASRPLGTQAISLTHLVGVSTTDNSAPHADSRGIAFDEDNNLIEVDDGGVYRRTNPRGLGAWIAVVGNLQNTETHAIAYDHNTRTLFAGTQDVGTVEQTAPGVAGPWESLLQGDGGVVAAYSQGNGTSIRYGSVYYLLNFFRLVIDASNNLVSYSFPSMIVNGTGQSVVQDPGVQFYAAMVVNPINGNVYAGGQRVYESSDGGTSFDIRRDLTSSGVVAAMSAGSANNAAALLVGAFGNGANKLYLRAVAGGALNPVPGYDSISGGASVTGVSLSRLDFNKFAVINRSQVLYTIDKGATLMDITGTLLNGRSRPLSVVVASAGSGEFIFVGLAGGQVYFTTSAPGFGGLGTWTRFGTLPNAPAYDLEYDQADDLLALGTIGRGTFMFARATLSLGSAPVGTCCAPDHTCTLTAESACPSRWAPGGSCQPVNGCLFLGACCASIGSCVSATQSQCEGVLIVGGVCAPNPCPEPLGTCCFTDGSCARRTPSNCPGTWGIGGSCLPNPCANLSSGACCAGGRCNVLLRPQCTGDWIEGKLCNPDPCAHPTGACCLNSVACRIVTQTDCRGDWMGGATCFPTPCPQPTGTCCSALGECRLGRRGDCEATWSVGGACTPNPCLQPSGACCISGGECSIRTAGNCASVNGSYRGDRSICSNADYCSQVCPTITAQPLPQSVCVGATVTFTFGVFGTPQPQFRWRKDGVEITGATRRTLTIRDVDLLDAGVYTCTASNPCGVATSDPVTLSVSTGAPVITVQPAPAAACAGGRAVLRVRAPGPGTKAFQWRKNGVNITGATGNALVFEAVIPMDAGRYDCVVSNACGSTTSAAAALVVNTAAPVITLQPVSFSVCAPNGAVFSVRATGGDAKTFQWRRNGVNLPGETANTLRVNPPVAGGYDCIVTNACGGTPSNVAVLSVSTGEPVISLQPEPVSACAGETVDLHVRATGAGARTFQWRRNAVNIAGATTNTLHLSPVVMGRYDCIVSNACGSTYSRRAMVTIADCPTGSCCLGTGECRTTTEPACTGDWTVGEACSPQVCPVLSGAAALGSAPCPGGAPVIGEQPQSLVVGLRGRAVFTVALTNAEAGTASCLWLKDGKALPDSAPGIRGRTTAALSIDPVRPGDAGVYRAVVSNACGSAVSTSATLTVCIADFDGSGDVGVGDLLGFLGAWFDRSSSADVNQSGTVTVQDVFDFLNAWSGGCPR